MSTDITLASNPFGAQEAAMLSALAALLHCDAFLTEHLETLVAVERDTEAVAMLGSSLVNRSTGSLYIRQRWKTQ